ncbi:PepSY-associated TM helix domain-containing protein [Niveispirillum irakense]|uniref:PepSY-associated TM helix domain-containing protein n=1 Tax=Niveispirillum irakense TaxID=34011 RepID=UPI000400EE3B|nr:PepSY-associated TM helix domain-containing protein [Niveispirillum irakense]
MTDVSAAKPKRQPLLPPGFVAAVLKGHSGLGLAFAAILYLVCLTGTIAVFVHELERWENATAPRQQVVSPEVVQTALEAAVAASGEGLEHVFITLPGKEFPWLKITTDAAGVDRHWIGTADGTLVEGGASPWTEFLTELHIQLHLPRSWGAFLVGLTGVALLSSLISGILAHPRIFRDAFHLRLGGARRLQEADLHNRIGVWALPFHFTISLTGALLGLTTLIVGVLGLAVFQGDTEKVYALFVPPHPADDPRPAPLLDLRPMFAELSRQTDGRVTTIFLEHPTEMGGAAQFNLDDGSDRVAHRDSYTFDREGKLFFSKRAAENNMGEAIIGSLGQLHFGWFGGGLVKIAYGLLGLGLTYMALNGVTIWLARRRDKGRPAPRWERVWAATVWGQPLALAGSAILAVAMPSVTPGLVLVVWGALTLVALAAAFLWPAEMLSRFGRLLSGGSLVLLPLLHALLRMGEGADPMGWAVNAALLAMGLLILASLRRRKTALVE